MRIIPPSPTIDLYKNGFDGFDLLARKRQGEQLSELVERIEDPLVIAIDGPWGSGKSFFLKCWVGAHGKENGGSAQTVYFDAFENDFLDDPLISLTSAISNRLPEASAAARGWEKAKNAAAVLWRPAARITLAVVTAGASEGAGAIATTGINAVHGELDKQVEALWRREECHRRAMADFREPLIALTHPNDKSGGPQKLVVTIDELDRCRPDYALSVLETIKHFFNVPHVHFVLGTNLEELSHIVCARYGENTNSVLYLQKFITITIALTTDVNYGQEDRPISLEYFYRMAQIMKLDDLMTKNVGDYLARPRVAHSLSLRAAERILTQMALIPQAPTPYTEMLDGYRTILCGLLVLKVLHPAVYKKFEDKTADFQQIVNAFSVNRSAKGTDDHFGWYIHQAWALFLKEEEVEEKEKILHSFQINSSRHLERTLYSLKRNYLDIVNFGVSRPSR
jgi:hypothetical protein